MEYKEAIVRLEDMMCEPRTPLSAEIVKEHNEALKVGISALEIADRLEKANANKTLYDYCVKCGICTQLNDTCKHRKNIHIGYNQALADIRGEGK